MKFYYKRLCPFCEEATSFSNYFNLRRHILELHQHILPARNNTDKEDKNAQYLKDSEGPEATSFKMSCPCCVFYTQTKGDLSSHIQARHIHFVPASNNEATDNTWIINRRDIFIAFYEFKQHYLENIVEYRELDQYFNQLLACSSTLVVQRKHRFNSIPPMFFTPGTLKAMYTALRNEHGLRLEFDADLGNSIKTMLKDFRDESKDLIDTSISLMQLAKAANQEEQNVILAITYLLPAMKELDNEIIHESELSTSYIHPFMQGLFTVNKENIIARCANIAISDNDEKKRPDYTIDLYKGYEHHSVSCVGEIKPANASSTSLVEDFYRLNLFSAEIINAGLPATMSFQVFGSSITFYFMVRRGNINVNVEVAKIALPLQKPDLLKLITCLDELFTIATLHNRISEMEKIEMKQISLLPLNLVESEKKTLPRKRKPSLESL